MKVRKFPPRVESVTDEEIAFVRRTAWIGLRFVAKPDLMVKECDACAHALVALVRAARATEREACAVIAGEWWGGAEGRRIASEIRQRG